MSTSLTPLPREDDWADGQIERLIDEARDGSKTALGRLLESARKYLLPTATRNLDQRLKSKVGASDVVQETCCEAHRAFPQFRGQTEQELKGWLLAILAHRIATFVRSYRESQRRNIDREMSGEPADWELQGLCDGAPTPGTATVAREEERRVQSAMAQLREPLRSVLIARTWHNMSFVEIGEQHGCSADAARKTWTRAVQALQKLLHQIE